MKLNQIPEICKKCIYLKIVALDMGNNHDYGCGKYPITKVVRESYCPIKKEE